MTFNLATITLLSAVALLYSVLLPPKWRAWALLAGSVLAIYWMQPPLNIRRLDYILPTFTLTLTVALWWFTRRMDDEAQAATRRQDRSTLLVIAGITLAISAARYLDAGLRLTSDRPPEPLHVGLVLLAVGLAAGYVGFYAQKRAPDALLTTSILLVIGLFIVMKTEPLAVEVSRFLRRQTGQDPALAAFADTAGWLGFSYVAFRLIHTVRDRQTGKLPALSLREYVTYVIFFPAYISGPIDRAERFARDLRALPDMARLAAPRFIEGFTRIMAGVFKKFVLADTLALSLALNTTNAVQTEAALWLWVLLYGYGLRLFFDFSGYSDIAIGIGILFGVRLPENFDNPYLKNNITTFWQSWHMTLSNWARFYVFTPLSRVLLTRPRRPSPTLVVFMAQCATMVVIGLWHGVTLNFLIWGLWHGLGLFAHKQWSDRTRKWYLSLKEKPRTRQVWTLAGWFLTFHYVLVGWVWFALPETEQSWRVLGRLFGVT